MAAVVRKPAAPLTRPCARCGEPFPVTRFYRALMCPACRAASCLESLRASRARRRKARLKAAGAWR